MSKQNTFFVAFLDIVIPNGNDSLKSGEKNQIAEDRSHDILKVIEG